MVLYEPKFQHPRNCHSFGHITFSDVLASPTLPALASLVQVLPWSKLEAYDK